MVNLRSALARMTWSLFIVILLFVGCLVLLFVFAHIVLEHGSFAFDDGVRAAIQAHISPRLTGIINVITFFGSQNFLIPANLAVIFFYLFVLKRKRAAIHITTVALVSVGVLFLLKDTLQRQRPLMPLIAKAHGYSFPSGHTVSSVTFFWLLLYIAWRNIRPPVWRWLVSSFLFIMPFLIGISRIYLNVHYASDVIAGFCVGIAWLLLAKWLLVDRHNPASARAELRNQPVLP